MSQTKLYVLKGKTLSLEDVRRVFHETACNGEGVFSRAAKALDMSEGFLRKTVAANPELFPPDLPRKKVGRPSTGIKQSKKEKRRERTKNVRETKPPYVPQRLFSDEAMIAALELHNGNRSAVANEFGVSRQAVHNRVKLYNSKQQSKTDAGCPSKVPS